MDMKELGFKEHNRYFIHEDTKFFIEFPSGPLGLGDAPVDEIAEIDTEAGVLRLLTPTDCLRIGLQLIIMGTMGNAYIRLFG